MSIVLAYHVIFSQVNVFLSRQLPLQLAIQEGVVVDVVMARYADMEHIVQISVQLREPSVRQYVMHVQTFVSPAAELAPASRPLAYRLDYILVEIPPLLRRVRRIVPRLPFPHPAIRDIHMDPPEYVEMYIHNHPSF